MAKAPRSRLYGLTARDRASLEEGHRQAEQRPGNTRREGSQAADVDAFFDETTTPEVYIAFTPSDGIPALDPHTTGTANDDEPGSAACDVYRIIQQSGGLDATGTDAGTGTGTGAKIPILHPVPNLSKLVYNLSGSDVPGDSWVVIIRDKFGSWLVPPPDLSRTCGGAGWDECHKRITDVRVYCLTGTGGDIVTEIDVEYVRRCHGDLYAVNDVPCGVTLTLAGVADGSCVDCESLNGTFALLDAGDGTWEAASAGTVCGLVLGLVLAYSALEGEWTLTAISGVSGIQVWSTTDGGIGWDGSTSLTLTSVGGNGSCTGWPSSVTINPG